MIHVYISKVMDGQIGSETLHNILENYVISLSGRESYRDLLVPDLDVNSHEDTHTTNHAQRPFSILDELMTSPATHNSTITTTSTTSSTISHPLSFMITSTAHSTISTTNPMPTIRHQPATTTLSNSTTPPLHTSYNTSPLQLTQIQHPPRQQNPELHPPFSLFHVNACSLSKNFDDLQYLLSCTKKISEITAVSETRVIKNVSLLNSLKLNNNSFDFTPTETCAGGTLLYIANHHINVVMI